VEVPARRGHVEGRVAPGGIIILAGIAGMVVVLHRAVPVAEGLAAWTVAGLGMGLAYAPLSLMMPRKARPGGEGRASASLNLADVLGTAIGIAPPSPVDNGRLEPGRAVPHVIHFSTPTSIHSYTVVDLRVMQIVHRSIHRSSRRPGAGPA